MVTIKRNDVLAVRSFVQRTFQHFHQSADFTPILGTDHEQREQSLAITLPESGDHWIVGVAVPTIKPAFELIEHKELSACANMTGIVAHHGEQFAERKVLGHPSLLRELQQFLDDASSG